MIPRPGGAEGLIVLGILLMLFGDFMFALNDALGKWLVASFSVGQVVLIRSIGFFLVLAPMLLSQQKGTVFRIARPGLVFLRAVLTTVDTACFYAAVVHLPLADVMSFYMAAPIYVAALSHFFLREQVGWRRWMAIGIGFCGVLIMLKPSSSAFSLSAAYAIVGSLAFAISLILSRFLRGTSDATLVTWQTIGGVVLGAILTIGAWRTPSVAELLELLLLGIVSCSAHLLITRSLKLAPASTLAPLQYTMLIWGALLGYLVFGDIPESRIWIGSAIVVLAGLFIFHRQKVVADVPPENVPKGVS
ncbi:MAG: multidrug DMT transporter permease [Rhizobiales bacterium 65-79]|nr:MAG: multidrug DMT transporter permease [Rhizobiales bacterium 65-79]